MPQRYALKDIHQIVNKTVFFDANIIIYLIDILSANPKLCKL